MRRSRRPGKSPPEKAAPPRTAMPNPRATPRFAGIATLCRFPRLADVAREHQPVDWALYGVPFDSGVTYRPGARFAPRAIRAESQYVKPYHVEHNLMLTDILSLADAGDSPTAPYDLEANVTRVAEFAASLGDPRSTRLLAVGGDHSIALANIRATHARHGGKRPLALIHFDSHLDTTDRTFDHGYSHASPFIRAIEEGLIDPRMMLSVGIKGPLNTPRDLDYAREHGVTIVTREDLLGSGPARIDAFMKRLAERAAYLTFDIDVIDPAFAPGTGTPSVGGLSSTEAFGLLRRLATRNGPPNIVGADVVEVLPDRDPQGITSLLAGHIIMEVLCLDALRRLRK
ncbi:MAG: agmatinase [Phycisphaerae bacterium]|nr:agmatinase [Phycisphaerae bacterium]